MTEIHRAEFEKLDARTLYELIRLRVDVFVVEQECPYRELDGVDHEPGTEHWWTADAAGPTSYLRTFPAGGDLRIGRVCTRADARGQGLSGALLRAVLDAYPGRPSVLGAQAHLADWYARFGYAVTGETYLEDGIPHVGMRRPG